MTRPSIAAGDRWGPPHGGKRSPGMALGRALRSDASGCLSRRLSSASRSPQRPPTAPPTAARALPGALGPTPRRITLSALPPTSPHRTTPETLRILYRVRLATKATIRSQASASHCTTSRPRPFFVCLGLCILPTSPPAPHPISTPTPNPTHLVSNLRVQKLLARRTHHPTVVEGAQRGLL